MTASASERSGRAGVSAASQHESAITNNLHIMRTLHMSNLAGMMPANRSVAGMSVTVSSMVPVAVMVTFTPGVGLGGSHVTFEILAWFADVPQSCT